jgi:hypothetical protein
MKKKNTLRATEGQQLTEDEIKAFVTHYESTGSLPGNKIVCTASGKLTTCVGPWRSKKIKEYGSLENLLRTYKCRGVNKKIKELKIKGISKPKKEKEEKTYSIPVLKGHVSRVLTGSEMTEMTTKICSRPDIFLNNGRHCLDCPTYELCANSMKCLVKGFAFKNGEFVEA